MNETLRLIDGRSVLRVERRFSHPPEKVWRALTESAHLAHWFPSDVAARLDGRALDCSVWDRAAELAPGYAASFSDDSES